MHKNLENTQPQKHSQTMMHLTPAVTFPPAMKAGKVVETCSGQEKVDLPTKWQHHLMLTAIAICCIFMAWWMNKGSHNQLIEHTATDLMSTQKACSTNTSDMNNFLHLIKCMKTFGRFCLYHWSRQWHFLTSQISPLSDGKSGKTKTQVKTSLKSPPDSAGQNEQLKIYIHETPSCWKRVCRPENNDFRLTNWFLRKSAFKSFPKNDGQSFTATKWRRKSLWVIKNLGKCQPMGTKPVCDSVSSFHTRHWSSFKEPTIRLVSQPVYLYTGILHP